MIQGDFNLKGTSETKDSSVKSTLHSGKTPKKEFQKVFAKDEGESRGQEQEKKKLVSEEKFSERGDSFRKLTNDSNVSATDQKKMKSPSLFDLVGGGEEINPEEALDSLEGDETVQIEELPEEIQKGALTAIQRGYGLKEQGDLTEVNPYAAIDQARPFVQGPEVLPQENPKAPPSNMKELIDQMINKLYLIETGSKTESVITLKHPPLFAGSTIVMTRLSTAKKELNISFENLSQQAKAILDRTENTNALKSGLTQKGYTIHMITTTTLAETQVFSSEKTERQGFEEGQQEGKSSGKKKGQAKDDE